MQPASPLQSAADLPLARQPVRELAWLIRTRAVSPVEVLDAHLKVIERLHPKLNAIVTLAADQARDAARRAESAVMKGEPLGPLHGLPVAIKDVTPTAGIRTTFASPLYQDHVPVEDAEVVRGSRPPAPSCLPRPTRPNSPAGRIPTARCSGRRAIRGIRT
jgi:amidase